MQHKQRDGRDTIINRQRLKTFNQNHEDHNRPRTQQNISHRGTRISEIENFGAATVRSCKVDKIQSHYALLKVETNRVYSNPMHICTGITKLNGIQFISLITIEKISDLGEHQESVLPKYNIVQFTYLEIMTKREKERHANQSRCKT